MQQINRREREIDHLLDLCLRCSPALSPARSPARPPARSPARSPPLSPARSPARKSGARWPAGSAPGSVVTGDGPSAHISIVWNLISAPYQLDFCPVSVGGSELDDNRAPELRLVKSTARRRNPRHMVLFGGFSLILFSLHYCVELKLFYSLKHNISPCNTYFA